MLIEDEPQAGLCYYGKIPIRNVWLLVLYASDFYYRLAGDKGKFGIEDTPEDIPDIVGNFLADAVENRLSNSLTCRYELTLEERSRVRGKIDILRTERRKLLNKGKVACRIEYYTSNTPRNRLVRAALEHASKKVIAPELAFRCAKLATKLRHRGVIGARPSRAELSAERFGQQDRHDAIMISAALLLFDLLLPLTTSGNYIFTHNAADVKILCQLYEKGVAGFYKTVATRKGWNVEAGKWQDWQIHSSSQNATSIFPKMQLDIFLEHRENARRIIIDTKFTKLTTKTLHHNERLRSHYIYQIYAYLRSQEKLDNPTSYMTEGILLHPSIEGENINEYVNVQGHVIRFATINLAGSSANIQNCLLSFLG